MAPDILTADSAPSDSFEPLSPRCLANPYVSYRRLREEDPVHWHEGLRSWIVTSYRECVSVLTDGDRFGTDFRKIGEITPPELLSLQTLDPPDQTPLRQLAHKALRTVDLEALAERAARRLERIWWPHLDRGQFDLISDVIDPFTLATITDLLGVDPPPVDSRFDALNDDLDRSMDAGLDPESLERGLRARASFNELVESWLAGPPEGSLLEFLVEHQQEGGVTHDVLVNSVRAFFHAGFEVPSRFLGNAVLALLREPGGWEALDGAPIDVAVEELVRFCGPVQALSRACYRDTVLRGREIQAGQVVTALIAAANRDPREFRSPDELVLTRSPNPHIGFGRGPHSCLGLQVARMEARALFSLLQAAPVRIRLADSPVIRPNATLRGLAALPVRVA